jgi:hypothetical protein
VLTGRVPATSGHEPPARRPSHGATNTPNAADRAAADQPTGTA